MPIWRVSVITSGNMGAALAKAFEQFDLPPPKILIDKSIDSEVMSALKDLRADIYAVNLPKQALYDDTKILQLTDNLGGMDLTSSPSSRSFPSPRDFYGTIAKEIFAQKPDRIYAPYGSGRLYESLLFYQDYFIHYCLPHQYAELLNLGLDKHTLTRISVIGVRPEAEDSKADKLTAHHNPFVLLPDGRSFNLLTYSRESTAALRRDGHTGPHSDIIDVSEIELERAYSSMNQEFDTCYSASAGLAGYLSDKAAGNIKEGEKIIIVNTGKGI